MTAIPGMEGHLTIGLTVLDGQVADVTLSSSRPVQSGQIFNEQPAHQALGLMPLIFAVCGTAQSVAGLKAVERAIGWEPGPSHEAARQFALGTETAREHLVRMLTDWPSWLDWNERRGTLARIYHWPKRARDLLYPRGDFTTSGGGQLAPDLDGLARLSEEIALEIEGEILGLSPHRFLEQTKPEDWLKPPTTAPDALGPAFLAWLQASSRASLGNAALTPLPKGNGDKLAESLGGDHNGAFAARPTWEGQPMETNPFSRNRGHPLVEAVVRRWGSGLLARHMARLVDLAYLPDRLAGLRAALAEEAVRPGSCPATGTGFGMVEAARGRLVHWVALREEAIREYRILAPTEWNFHPKGVLARALDGMPVDPDPERVRREASLIIQALDPCIGFEIEVYHA